VTAIDPFAAEVKRTDICTIGRVRLELDETDRAMLDAYLAKPETEISSTAIKRVLERHYQKSVSKTSVTDHRRKVCLCVGKPKPRGSKT
jgi:hypothetical protein